MSALIEIEQRDGICILHCRGRFVPGPDIEYVYAKMDDIKRLNCAKVLADFREVLSLGSTGISFIVSVYNSVHRHSGGHFVIADIVASVRKVLDLTRLSTVIPIAEDFSSAWAAIHGGDAAEWIRADGISGGYRSGRLVTTSWFSQPRPHSYWVQQIPAYAQEPMTQLPLHDTETRNNIALMTKYGTERKSRRERRVESRHPVSEPGVIKSRTAGIAVAQVLDTSPSGLRVTAPCPFPVDAQIEVLFEDAKVSGCVRNCVRVSSTEFHVGIANAKSGSTDVPDWSGIYAQLDRLTDVLR